ncbi:MAG: M1 family metallopeptidase [Candidatus Micrarchaeales archaeon]|jgi:tricorn protease interacting factor F2/3
MKSNKRSSLGINVLPLRYHLEFEPNPKIFRFRGEEEIEIKINKKTREISLNSAELAIKEAQIIDRLGEQKASISIRPKEERIVLRVNRPLIGNAKIRISFSGINNNKMYGFYRSSYLDGKKKRFILTTQFEPVDARKCFPCFDEPELKAFFKVSLIVPKELECISNTRIKRAEYIGNKKKVSFEETPRMSTYLLYLGVGDFERVRGNLGRMQLSTITTKGKKKLAKLPLDYAKKFMKFYNSYFKIDYPLPKLDLIAIPDFSAGAMENWGAITFRETRFLGDNNSSLISKQGIAEIIAHEMAHQWFGDLVTMKWWDDLWLNESFATFMGYKTINELFPEWEMEKQLLSDAQKSINSALTADQLRATHPVSTKVNDPKEISSIFDSISYEKGSAILRMIEDYVGEDVFRSGLHSYLKRYSYSNAVKDDLWNAIDEVADERGSKKSVGKIASYWVNTAGYPIIKAKISSGGIALSQNRFVVSSDEKKASNWPIPVRYITGSGTKETLLLSSPSKELHLETDKIGFIKFNHGQKGVYRVWYDGGLLLALGKAMKEKKIDSIDAWGVENDLFAFARSGKIKLKEYLSFVSKFCLECAYPVNSSLLLHLNSLYLMLYGTEPGNEVKRVLAAHCSKLLKKLGFAARNKESSIDAVLRGSVIASLGLIKDKRAIDKAKEIFDRYMKDRTAIDPNLKSAVYGTIARNGNGEAFEKFKKLYIGEHIPEDKIRFLAVLGHFPDEKLIKRALAFALSDQVRYQDTYIIPSVASSNPFTKNLVLEWTKRNWKAFKKRYPPGTMMLRSFISNMSVQKSPAARKMVADFLSQKDVESEDTTPEIKRTLEKIDTNIRFMEANDLL